MKLFLVGCLLMTAILNSCQSSCSNSTAKKLMGNLYEKKILFNKNMQLINKDRIDPKYAFDIYAPAKAFYVLHYFHADCDKCIFALQQAGDYIKKTEKDHPDLRYAFIASAPTMVYAQEAIAKLNFPYPLYFDSIYQGFPKINHLPADDILYHTMLLNNKNEVELFGGYYSNPKAADLFSEIINCHQ